ncbi:alpha-(1,3)-fucosyltransferase 7-like isoform X2 [Apostichopus japonicus]
MRYRSWKVILISLVLFMLYLFNLHYQMSETQSHQKMPFLGIDPYTFLPDPTTYFHFENTSPSSVQGCVKEILIYGNLTDMKGWPDLSHFYKYFSQSKRKDQEIFYRCHQHDCLLKVSLGTTVSQFRGKDAIIFGMLPKAFKGRLDRLIKEDPEDGQTWFFYSTETPLRIVDWNGDERISDLKYHKMMTYRLDSDIHLPFAYFRRYNDSERLTKLDHSEVNHKANKTKEAVWMSSNCQQIYWPRLPMLQRLQRLLPFDDFGKCGSFRCLPMRSSRCADIFRKYHFSLAFENSECYEYITERFWWYAVQHGVVPVVYGPPRSDLEIFAPPNSFIHVSDFDLVKDLAEHLWDVSLSPEKYNGYFEWKREGEIVHKFPHNIDTLCNILPHLGNWKVKRLGNSSWFNGCRRQPNEYMYSSYGPKQQKWEYILWSPWNPNSGHTLEEEKHIRMQLGRF